MGAICQVPVSWVLGTGSGWGKTEHSCTPVYILHVVPVLVGRSSTVLLVPPKDSTTVLSNTLTAPNVHNTFTFFVSAWPYDTSTIYTILFAHDHMIPPKGTPVPFKVFQYSLSVSVKELFLGNNNQNSWHCSSYSWMVNGSVAAPADVSRCCAWSCVTLLWMQMLQTCPC